MKSCLEELTEFLEERLTTNESVRQSHGEDESWLSAPPPDAVASPESTEEVAAILTCCSKHAVPVVPFGMGTSLEGHVLAVHGGLCLDFVNMNAVEEIRVDDLDVTVQAGVTRKELDERLRPHGLFFPVDPGANATIGGMVATGASGTTTVGYGAMRENVRGLEVVLADGRVIQTSHRARKSSAARKLEAPLPEAISSTSAACSETAPPEPWNSRKSVGVSACPSSSSKRFSAFIEL